MTLLEQYHICTNCGKRPTDGKHKTCEYCRERAMDYYRKHRNEQILYRRERYKKRIKAGLCFCGKPLTPGRVRCEKCLEKNREYYHKCREKMTHD